MMRKLKDPRLVVVALLFACLGMSCSENTRPDNTTEKLFVAQWALVGATNAVADLKGTVSDSDYDKAKQVVLDAAVVLNCGKFHAGVPGAKRPAVCPAVPDGSAISYLALLNTLLLEAAKLAVAQGEPS